MTTRNRESVYLLLDMVRGECASTYSRTELCWTVPVQTWSSKFTFIETQSTLVRPALKEHSFTSVPPGCLVLEPIP